MVFVSHRRPSHRTGTGHSSSHRHIPLVGTKRGEQCHHRFRCWFGLHCRGQHTDPEVAHFYKCDQEACQQLSVHQPASHQPPANQQRAVAPTDASVTQAGTLTEPTHNTTTKEKAQETKEEATYKEATGGSCRRQVLQKSNETPRQTRH